MRLLHTLRMAFCFFWQAICGGEHQFGYEFSKGVPLSLQLSALSLSLSLSPPILTPLSRTLSPLSLSISPPPFSQPFSLTSPSLFSLSLHVSISFLLSHPSLPLSHAPFPLPLCLHFSAPVSVPLFPYHRLSGVSPRFPSIFFLSPLFSSTLRRPACWPVLLRFRLSLRPSICLSVCPYFRPSVHLTVCLSPRRSSLLLYPLSSLILCTVWKHLGGGGEGGM